MAVKWLDQPEGHDYDAAAEYLSMLAEDATVEATVAALKANHSPYPNRLHQTIKNTR